MSENSDGFSGKLNKEKNYKRKKFSESSSSSDEEIFLNTLTMTRGNIMAAEKRKAKPKTNKRLNNENISLKRELNKLKQTVEILKKKTKKSTTTIDLEEKTSAAAKKSGESQIFTHSANEEEIMEEGEINNRQNRGYNIIEKNKTQSNDLYNIIQQSSTEIQHQRTKKMRNSIKKYHQYTLLINK